MQQNKKLSNQVNTLHNPQKILKVVCFTPIAKPLNGSLPRSNNSHFLKLYPITYRYKNGKEEKTAEAQTYMIKGLRGSLRHQAMAICKAYGLEVCHSTDKESSREGQKLLPEGFHLLGSCRKNGSSCILHQIFGSKGNEGKISVLSNPIACIKHRTFDSEIDLQNVHIAMENRFNKTFDGISVQDFGERYFSGEFEFEINVSLCSPEEIGLLIEVVMNFQKIGRGFNSGYGRVKVLKFQLKERKTNRIPVWDESDSFILKEEIIENASKEEVWEALEAWKQYLRGE